MNTLCIFVSVNDVHSQLQNVVSSFSLGYRFETIFKGD